MLPVMLGMANDSITSSHEACSGTMAATVANTEYYFQVQLEGGGWYTRQDGNLKKKVVCKNL